MQTVFNPQLIKNMYIGLQTKINFKLENRPLHAVQQ